VNSPIILGIDETKDTGGDKTTMEFTKEIISRL